MENELNLNKLKIGTKTLITIKIKNKREFYKKYQSEVIEIYKDFIVFNITVNFGQYNETFSTYEIINNRIKLEILEK